MPTEALKKKRFFGFSDVTALHRFFQRQVPGLVTFHSPMPATSLLAEGTQDSQDALCDALFGKALALACPPLHGRTLQIGRAHATGGVVTGRVVGGNLTLVTALVGTPWEVDVNGAILLIEDVNEAGYRIDRMLTQLNQAHGGKLFELIAGLVIGDVGDVVTKGNSQVDVDTSEWYWLKQFGLPKDLPVLIELPIGHITDARVAALGANGRLDLNGQTLIVGFRDLL